MTEIEKLRNEIAYYFDPDQFVEGSLENHQSPSGKFRLETSLFKQTREDANWEVTKVGIYTDKDENLFRFFGNDSRFFHHWAEKDGNEYLICAEDLFGGQTIIDLTNQKMETHTNDEDGFIWAEFYLSPDKSKLAILGCYWSGPLLLKVYDFQNPMQLPLKELNEISLISDEEEIKGWLNDEHLYSDQRESISILKD